MISQKTKYGLQAVIALAKHADGEPILITDLAKKERLPKKFLEAILLELKKAGILSSKKGKGGGYALARPAASIKVGEIVRVLEGPLQTKPKEHGEIQMIVDQLMEAVSDVLDNTTLEDVMDKARCCRDVYTYVI